MFYERKIGVSSAVVGIVGMCITTGHDARRRLLHVIGEEAAVRPGVGQQALFIQRLGVVKGLLGGEAEKSVGLPLQSGEVVELGRLFGFLLPLDGSADGSRSPAGRLDTLRLGGVRSGAGGSPEISSLICSPWPEFSFSSAIYIPPSNFVVLHKFLSHFALSTQ